MTNVDRWLLPDGVDDILPNDAEALEQLRRRLLDLYRTWGYDLVIPPLVEYTDSLLIGLGRDLELLTFKLTDQLSGRSLGVRADITPQTARIDAHRLKREGVNRLCYAGHVLHTKPTSPLGTRTPLKTGVELYGEASLAADVEVISLLLEALQVAAVDKASIEIGHVEICRELISAAKLSAEQEEELMSLLQRKAAAETQSWVAENIADPSTAALFCELPKLAGDRSVLGKANKLFQNAPTGAQAALAELESLAAAIEQRYPQAELYFDLSELHSFAYHTGIVFSAFVVGHGRALAAGGRYDHVGEVFGRARAATGFTIDLSVLYQLLGSKPAAAGIYAPYSQEPEQWVAIQKLRAEGERVVMGFDGDNKGELNCDRQLVFKNGQFEIIPWD